MRHVLLVALAAALLPLALAQLVPSCRWQYTTPAPAVTATFDLSPLTLTTPPGYRSEDDSDPIGETVDYYYWYNICAPLSAVPVTTPAGLCHNVTGSQENGAFYQVLNSTATHKETGCHIIGLASNQSWSLIEPGNPAAGVRQHYGNGDTCGNSGVRDIWVNFLCKKTGLDTDFGVVEEDNACDYELNIASVYACPIECPIVGDTVCGHGVCGSDRDLGRARCYCNTGYAGASCTEEASGGGGGSGHVTAGLTAFVIILVVALLAMAVILYRKIKKLNADDGRYSALTDEQAAAAARGGPRGVVQGGATAAHTADHGASSNLAAAVAGQV